jgi:mRNA interferase YafQ
MRLIILKRQCERDLKRIKRRGKYPDKLLAVADLLAKEGHLPATYRPHKLSGEYEGFWECHIEPDWLLIYDVTNTGVLLVRTGTHSDLFK